MRMVTWNIRYFSHAALGLTSLDATMRRIACALAQLQPQADVIALQEIDAVSLRSVGGRYRMRQLRGEPVSNFDRFIARLNQESAAIGGHTYQAHFFPAQGEHASFPLYSTGLSIIHQNGLHCVDHNADAPRDVTCRRLRVLAKFKQKRICAHVRLATSNGSTFDVFNTHLSLPAFFKPGNGPTGRGFGEADNQLAEVQNVLNYIGEYDSASRAILLGDFNAVPGSKVYNILATDFVDAHASHLGISPTELRNYPTGGFWRFRYRLDHIFCGAEVLVRDFEGTQPGRSDHPWSHLSDHSPLIARLSVD